MKTKHLLPVLCGFACVFFTNIAIAQVKIGTNPTTINAANNLEVEASTSGRKTSIDKTTGKMTIADGSQGDKRILTSDPNGVATWQAPEAQNTGVWVYAKQTGNQALNTTGFVTMQVNTEIFDRGNNFDPATSKITIPTTGIYQIIGGSKKTVDPTTAGGFNMYLGIFVNNIEHTNLYEDSWSQGDIRPRPAGALILQLNAGDIVDMRIGRNQGGPYSVGDSYLTCIKLSN
ncbi:hypothetical protein [Dyadobacter sp. 3J3]|uniref:hypothetical protein n=1 Tax=Dyadobacter sp. 3J3 TaxID=2606600 RepID=UPI00135BFFAB|nr:hypothetical protein [Dyadobacter sp. 3J3]